MKNFCETALPPANPAPLCFNYTSKTAPVKYFPIFLFSLLSFSIKIPIVIIIASRKTYTVVTGVNDILSSDRMNAIGKEVLRMKENFY